MIPLTEYNDVRKTVSNFVVAPVMFPSETETIEIVVNGETRRVPPGVDLSSLLEFLGVDASRVAVEYNRRIARKAEWNSTTIRSGDNLEIVQFVGGG
jgi:thiamine biosynthesis protein ThiS